MATPGSYSIAFGPTLLLTVPGTLHGLATADLVYELYDAAIPRNEIQAGRFSVHPATYTVEVEFAVPQSGRLVLLPARLAAASFPTPGPPSAPPFSGHLPPSLLALLNEVVLQRPYLTQDAYGKPTYGPQVARPARVEYQTTIVANQSGQARTSTTLLFLNGDLSISERDQVTLPDSTTPALQRVKAIRTAYAPAMIHHYEVQL